MKIGTEVSDEIFVQSLQENVEQLNRLLKLAKQRGLAVQLGNDFNKMGAENVLQFSVEVFKKVVP